VEQSRRILLDTSFYLSVVIIIIIFLAVNFSLLCFRIIQYELNCWLCVCW